MNKRRMTTPHTESANRAPVGLPGQVVLVLQGGGDPIEGVIEHH
jgi:hypothetical protein